MQKREQQKITEIAFKMFFEKAKKAKNIFSRVKTQLQNIVLFFNFKKPH